MFLLDLDHLLTDGFGFRELSERLSELAEAVVASAVAMAYDELCRRHGRPCTFAGLESPYTVLALGKFGGRALGYASDIELLFVYGDQGSTTGADRLPNREFYHRLVRDTEELIAAKREGSSTWTRVCAPTAIRARSPAVWRRLPPTTTSTERRCPTSAWRWSGCARWPATRPWELASSGCGTASCTRADRWTWRHSPICARGRFARSAPAGWPTPSSARGALVDVEYTVQILQVVHGSDTPALRTPSVHAALDELCRLEVIDHADAQALTDSYDFLRRLINGLRMLRGSARDLLLPATESAEYAHLARRIGYGGRGGLGEAAQLRTDFEVHTAAVRSFVDRRFAHESVPWGAAAVGPADLVLAVGTVAVGSDRAQGDAQLSFLRRAGFRDSGGRCATSSGSCRFRGKESGAARWRA